MDSESRLAYDDTTPASMVTFHIPTNLLTLETQAKWEQRLLDVFGRYWTTDATVVQIATAARRTCSLTLYSVGVKHHDRRWWISCAAYAAGLFEKASIVVDTGLSVVNVNKDSKLC